MNFQTRMKKGFKRTTAVIMAALLTAGCVYTAVPVEKTEVQAAASVLSDEARGVIYADSRTDFRDETIYFLITTRFYDGDTSNNAHCVDDTKAKNPDSDPAWRGDFKGLIDKLDYIKALGFTAIWITPVVQNNSSYDYHGYHAYDFTAVDYRYESNGVTYQDLIDACHAKGMKIIQDVVFNHSCNWGEKNLCDLSSYEVWAGERSEMMMGSQKGLAMDPNKIYHHFGYCGGGDFDNYNVQTMCLHSDCFDLNTENPTVYNYLIDCYKTFIDMGVDAFRVDTVKHMSRLTLNKTLIPALQEEYRKVHSGSGYDEFYMFGEVCTKGESTWYRKQAPISTCFYTWKDDDTWLGKWTSDPDANIALTKEHYDAHNDLSNQPTTDNALLRGNDYHAPDNSMRSGLDSIDFQMHWQFDSAGAAFGMAKAEDPYFSDSTWSVTYVNSHDYSPNKIQTIIPNFDQQTWAEDLDLIFTFRGIPCIYYGTEIQFQAGKPIDVGPNSPLSETGRAYFGDNIEGEIVTGDPSVYYASGAAKETLSAPLSQHLMRLNRLRQAIPALRKGQYSVEGVDGYLAFKRRYTDANTDSFCCVTISGGATFSGIPNGTYVDAVTGDTKTVTNGTLSINCSGQGNLRVYVLSTAKTPAPGRVVSNGSFMTDGGSAEIIFYNKSDIHVGNVVDETGVTLDKTSASIYEGKTTTLTATVAPSNATYKSVSWKSSNSNVATVSGGVVKGVSAGTATITATTRNGKTATCTVTVAEDPSIIKPTGITLNKTAITLEAKATETLTATVTPTNATDKTVTWTTSDSNIATVDGGVVKGVSAGTATITAKTYNGKTATCTVTVEQGAFTYIDHGVYFEKPSSWNDAYIYLFANGTDLDGSWPGKKMTDIGDGVYVYEYNATASNIGIVFNNGGNGSQSGDLDYKDCGYYTLSGYQKTITKPTTVDVTSVSVTPSTLSVNVGSTGSLTASVSPSNASNKTITWTSSNTSVATVSSSGVVTGVAAGTATITAKSNNGKTATATVTIKAVSDGSVTNSTTVSSTSVIEGNKVTFTGKASGGTAPYTYSYQYLKEGKTSWVNFGTGATMVFKPGIGTYTVKVTAKDSAGKTADKSFTITCTGGATGQTLANNSTVSATTIASGGKVTIYGKASGGTSPYTYTYQYQKSGKTTWTSFGSGTAAVFKPGDGLFTIKVTVKDSAGKSIAKSFTITCGTSTGGTLTNNSTASATTIASGGKVTFTGKATGGTAPYTYKYSYLKAGKTTWVDFATGASAALKPADSTYTVKVTVTDAAGKTATKSFTITCGGGSTAGGALTNSSSVSATTTSSSNKITITGKATGGTSPYYYSYYYLKSGKTSYNVIGSEMTTATSVNFKPGVAATYTIMVKVTDNTGESVTKTFTVKFT